MPTPSDHIDMIMSTKATAFATIVILAYISIRSTGPSSIETTLRNSSLTKSERELLQREVHGHRHDYRHRLTVQRRRRVRPLRHRIYRRRIEQRDGAQNARLLHLPVRSY